MVDSGSGARALHQKVKTARRRTVSSVRWLERQLNDPYVARARREGYRSRSAFKLIEIDDRFKILRPGRLVVDLGAAPGGWAQVAVARVGSGDAHPRIVGIDILPLAPMPGAVFLEMDFLDAAAPLAIAELLGGPPDIILSDMAAPTTGHKRTDQLRTANLYEAAADYALETLALGGDFLAKVFQGGTEAALLAQLKRHFASVHHVKPKASRAESVELYLLARGFRK